MRRNTIWVAYGPIGLLSEGLYGPLGFFGSRAEAQAFVRERRVEDRDLRGSSRPRRYRVFPVRAEDLDVPGHIARGGLKAIVSYLNDSLFP